MANESLTEEQKKANEADKKAKALEKSNAIPVVDKTQKNYVCPENEKADYHVVIEKKSFNPVTGDRQSRPQLQKMDAKSFANFEKNSNGLGYHITILHDPTGEYPECGRGKVLADLKKAKKEQK